MKTPKIIAFTFISLFVFSACNQTDKHTENSDAKHDVHTATLVDEVITKENQQALTPDMVIRAFSEGNERFRNNDLIARNLSAQVQKTSKGQFPQAIVLSCVDSRVPVETIFDQSIGDIFVARVAGNFVNEDILGSMEFACKVSGSKLILVLGHESCGAVKAAIDDVKLGNITPMLSKIKPAFAAIDYSGERNSNNTEFVAMACESNIRNTINEIRTNSPILKEMEDNMEIKIIGGVYDLDTGNVNFID